MNALTARRPRRRSRRARFLQRLLGSVSARLLLVILMSVVPMGVLGGLMAWHSYRATLEASSNRAAMVAEGLAAQIDQEAIGTGRLLNVLSGRPELGDPARCAILLDTVRRLQAVPLDALLLVDPSGHVLCPSGRTGTLALPTGRPDRTSATRLTALLDGGGETGRPLLRMTRDVSTTVGPALLLADIPLGWDPLDPGPSRVGAVGHTRAWLVGADDRLVPLCENCGWPAPGPPDRLGGKEGRFFKRDMVDHLGLLVTTEASRAESYALSVFIWRVLGIALVLALCLAAVLVGAAVLISRPLRAVTRSVTEWRRAGAFGQHATRWTPIELRQLSHAFGDATHALAAHEERLQRAETNQALLIKEIHHRVKNNLQIIASLLNLQANRIRQPEARAEFASARDRVRALATLHRHLYSEGELHTLNMRSFLEELCGQLFQAIGEKEGRRIRLEIEAPEIVMSTDQAVPLALVVTEAVSNAIKYAFPNGRSGLVSVRLAEQVEGIATLVIQDNGVGIPAGRAETETGIRDGLGIQLIRGFARQLGATLEVMEGEPGPDGGSEGTRYTLMVPLHPKVETYDDSEQPAPAPHATMA